MHHALLLVAAAIARALDAWLLRLGRRRSLAGRAAILEDKVARLLGVPGRRRPHYRRNERMDMLWHAARHRLSVEQAARVFVVTPQTILNWHRVLRRKEPHLLPPLRGLPDLVHDLVHRLKAEWPRWGTRRVDSDPSGCRAWAQGLALTLSSAKPIEGRWMRRPGA